MCLSSNPGPTVELTKLTAYSNYLKSYYFVRAGSIEI